LTNGNSPTEAQLDTVRLTLLDFFNDVSLGSDNLANGSVSFATLDRAIPDDVSLKWTSSHANMQYISSLDDFSISNTQGSLVWGTISGTTVTDYFKLRSSDGSIVVEGIPRFNTDLGVQDVDLLWLLSRYRKPRLVYTDSNIITVEDNGIENGQLSINSAGVRTISDKIKKEELKKVSSLSVSKGGELTGQALYGSGQTFLSDLSKNFAPLF
jgi:hypothetical protein